MNDTQPTARAIATQVLFRVAQEGAWAAPTLDVELRRAKLEPRDAALATAIVYGALRVLPELDAAIDAHAKRPSKIDDWVRAAMRVAVYQIRHLPRIPVRAAVHQTVGLVKAKRGRLGGFANAVLRKIERPDDAQPPRALVIPQWVRKELERSLGDERSASFLETRPLPPPIDLRVVGDRAEMIADLTLAAPNAEVTAGIVDQVVHVRGAGDPRTWPGYEQGRFSVQEQGAQWVGELLGAQPGERILDACAGRGGKTTQLARIIGRQGEIWSVDLHETRLKQIEGELTRLKLNDVPHHRLAVDWTVGTGGLEPGSFDRVLVDAPCTGLGTIHRRPEILLRLSTSDITTLADTQRAILEQVLPLVRPGGELVYAVCSPSVAEGPGVTQAFAEKHQLEVSPAGLAADEDGIIRIGPWLDGCDAYQVARWKIGV